MGFQSVCCPESCVFRAGPVASMLHMGACDVCLAADPAVQMHVCFYSRVALLQLVLTETKAQHRQGRPGKHTRMLTNQQNRMTLCCEAVRACVKSDGRLVAWGLCGCMLILRRNESFLHSVTRRRQSSPATPRSQNNDQPSRGQPQEANETKPNSNDTPS